MTMPIGSVRTANNGYILTLRWPYGGQPLGGGEVIAATWAEVIYELTNASDLGINIDQHEELRRKLKELFDPFDKR